MLHHQVHGALDQAEASYVAVAESETGKGEKAHAAFGLGTVHRRRGADLGAAVRCLRDACGLEPASARFWCALGGAAEALARRAASGRVDKRKVDLRQQPANQARGPGACITQNTENFEVIGVDSMELFVSVRWTSRASGQTPPRPLGECAQGPLVASAKRFVMNVLG